MRGSILRRRCAGVVPSHAGTLGWAFSTAHEQGRFSGSACTCFASVYKLSIAEVVTIFPDFGRPTPSLLRDATASTQIVFVRYGCTPRAYSRYVNGFNTVVSLLV